MCGMSSFVFLLIACLRLFVSTPVSDLKPLTFALSVVLKVMKASLLI